jgi:hypothetical protein
VGFLFTYVFLTATPILPFSNWPLMLCQIVSGHLFPRGRHM